MTDHADLIARLRERLSKHPGQITVDRDLIADICEAADALSRLPVTEEMVERVAEKIERYGLWSTDPAVAHRAALPVDLDVARERKRQYIRTVLSAAAALGTPAAAAERVRHRKRGTTYTVVGSANIQTDTPLTDNAAVIVYRSEHDGKLWVRPVSEFHDGRFEVLTAGRETYPGHDPAAGLPQPDTADGADPQDAEYFAILSRSTKNPKRLYREDEVAAIRAEATAKERERAETWRRVAIDCLERILKMVEPRSAIAEEAGVALVALKPARKQ